MATKQQIRETAAENLGILGEGETLPSYESDDIDQAYIEVFNELQALNLTAWPITGDIPDQYARSIAILVAEARVIKYQKSDQIYNRIRAEKEVALARIRELQAKPKLGQTEIENF